MDAFWTGIIVEALMTCRRQLERLTSYIHVEC